MSRKSKNVFPFSAVTLLRPGEPPAATEGEFKIDEQPILSKYAEQRILQI